MSANDIAPVGPKLGRFGVRFIGHLSSKVFPLVFPLHLLQHDTVCTGLEENGLILYGILQ